MRLQTIIYPTQTVHLITSASKSLANAASNYHLQNVITTTRSRFGSVGKVMRC